MAIHDRIEEVLAAAVHNELTDAERRELHLHLVECEDCRQRHKEDQLMNRAMEEVFSNDKPDHAFEKRVLHSFRNGVRHGDSVGYVFGNLLRSRAVQFTGAAAVLLTLVQMGRLLTGEPVFPRWSTTELGNEEIADNSNASRLRRDLPQSSVGQFSATKSGALSSGLPAAAPKSQPPEQPVQGAGVDDRKKDRAKGESERSVVTGSNVPVPEEVGPNPTVAPSTNNNRKLIRNASVDLEIDNFEEAAGKITAYAQADGGYVATTSSEKQENGKLKGEIVVKVLPQNLDVFLQKLHGLGDLKNQTLGTDDVTKQYYDSEARLKTAQAMEERLLDLLKKKSDDVNDLLAVEKELGRVRGEIEQLQGEIKTMDAQVLFATVTIALAERDLDTPAGFLLRERARLSLFGADVEKTYNDIKALASPTVQITSATLDRDNAARVSAHITMLIAPEESEGVIARVKSLGRVNSYQTAVERVARGGQGMASEAKTERDKVELDITITREEQEPAFQETSLSIRAKSVNDGAKQLRAMAEKRAGRVLASSFSRDPNGREFSNVSVRVPMKNYPALMQELAALGQVENVSVHRQENADNQTDTANAPAELRIQIYSRGNLITEEAGVLATLRRTLSQGAAALMWSVQMIGVALAFVLPWLIPIVLVLWLTRRYMVARARKRNERL